ncbi:MAG: putative rRNA maturation factor, partial [Candidatus Peregrinibacteria bacterium GW2011_GWA2_47_7]
MIKIKFYKQINIKVPRTLLLKVLRSTEKVLGKLKKIPTEALFTIECTFVGNPAMARLNRVHREKDTSTDVISLSYFHLFNKKIIARNADFLVGELFISVPYARAQAKKLGHTFTEELEFLF